MIAERIQLMNILLVHSLIKQKELSELGFRVQLDCDLEVRGFGCDESECIPVLVSSTTKIKLVNMKDGRRASIALQPSNMNPESSGCIKGRLNSS